MEQNSADKSDGSCCALCGQYFKDPKKDDKGRSLGIYVHNKPVVCKACWYDKCRYPIAEVDTFLL